MLAQHYSALSADFIAFGLRDRLYSFLAGNYRLGSLYKESPDDYWRDVRQKPNDRNVMRSVLAFTMRAKGRGQRVFRTVSTSTPGCWSTSISMRPSLMRSRAA